MHIVYLGIISRPEDIGKIGEASVAGNKMQYNILKYLSRYDDVKIDVVSFHPYKPFRRSKKLFVRRTKEKLFDNVDLWQVGYINLPIIKQLMLPGKTTRMAKRLLCGDDVIMAFDMYPTQGIPMSKLKKRVNGKTICLLADLSIGGTRNLHGVKKLLRRIYDKNTLSNIRKCDHYIALNENAIQQYAPHSKYLIVDGGIEPSEFAETKYYWDGKEKNIVYTGALVDYSGIMNLVNAMDLLEDKDIVLDIYGDGILKQEITDAAAKNPRVRYHGRVTNAEAMRAQQSAWLLANPRPNDSLIAKVTFPSKIFEYLMSGRPVMTTRLNGFSEDYDKLLFWIEDGTAEAIAECIGKINEKNGEQLQRMANDAKEYLLKHKTWELNVDRIHDFMIEVFEKNNTEFKR